MYIWSSPSLTRNVWDINLYVSQKSIRYIQLQVLLLYLRVAAIQCRPFSRAVYIDSEGHISSGVHQDFWTGRFSIYLLLSTNIGIMVVKYYEFHMHELSLSLPYHYRLILLSSLLAQCTNSYTGGVRPAHPIGVGGANWEWELVGDRGCRQLASQPCLLIKLPVQLQFAY